MNKRRALHVPTLISATLAGLLLAGCGVITAPGRLAQAARDLSVNMDRWRDHGYSSYDYVVANQCFCVQGGVPVRISVRANVIVSVVYAGNDQPLPSELAAMYRDVNGLFQVVRSAIDDRADSIRAFYDPTTGHPADVFIDYRKNAADEEFGFHVISFDPVAR